MIFIRSMWGLGDNIFQRPFVRAAVAHCGEVYIDTPWPELYSDMPLKFVRNPVREGRLRTQTKNVRKQPPSIWVTPPKLIEEVQVGYGRDLMGSRNIPQAMERSLPLRGAPFVFDLPNMGSHRFAGQMRPIAVVRPVTVRHEWRNEARNPRPQYIAEIAGMLMQTHFVVSIADLSAGHEWAIAPLPPAHVQLHHGELAVRELMALVRDADAVIGGVGWIVPATIALKTDCFVILGGMLGHNAPNKITDSRMDLSRIGFADPDRPCGCVDMHHKCDKTISNLSAQFDSWLDQIMRANHNERDVERRSAEIR
jgi:hypothetical protein